MISGARNIRIDVIRGISILLVVFHHFNIPYPMFDTSVANLIGRDAVHAVARNGNYAVTMFFAISGFLITSNADRRWNGLGNVNLVAFYGLRVARIIPTLLLLLFAVNVLAAFGPSIFANHVHYGKPVSFWLVNAASLTFWMNILIGTHGWVNYPLGVLWSLSVEEVFYLSFPIMCLWLRHDWRLMAFWIAIVIVGPLYRLSHQGDEAGFLYSYFACFDGIAIGCLTALIAKRFPMNERLLSVSWPPAAIIMTAIYLYRPIEDTNILGVTAMALSTGVLLWGAANAHQNASKKHSSLASGVGWYGRLSYELYLFHLIVLGVVRSIYPPATTHGDAKLALFAVYFALSTAVSFAIARIYAEPLNKIIRSKWSERSLAHQQTGSTRSPAL